MKKLLITALMLTFAFSSNSQDVFKRIFNNAEKIVNDPNSNPTILDVCNFEVMALKYLKQQAFKSKAEVEVDFLDNQAYYMTQYINSFFKNLSSLREQPKEQKKMIITYMKTSCDNPLFDDNDTETTECFVTDSASFIRFSLNTDWENGISIVFI
ncbi:MAG: hypothetical protein IKR18_04565 [Bacteroidaceae bacterium]|nr:hypothetical protein [Bacteroidaceae bacterium]